MSIRIPRYLGTDVDGKKVELPADAATQGFAILGKRGRGKSTLAADMMEIFAADGIPFVVFDPPGAHWGIRFEAGDDGKPVGSSGFDVLLVGGEHGDVPLEQTSAQDLARIIVETDLSCVIDLKALSYTALQRYYSDFAEELFKINRTVRHLFFEEAQNVAPQQLKFDEQKRALYATEKLIDEGRGIGLGFTLISQRPAAVNKSVLTQTDNMLSLGMFAPQDIDQVEAWFEHHVKGDTKKLREIVDDIAGMKMGECWLLSPDRAGLMVKFHVRQRVTYHAGRTPKPGERAVNVDKFSVTEAVDKLKKLFTTKQVARQQEVKDLGEANKRIRELEKQIRAGSKHKVQPAAADSKTDSRAIERAVRQHDAKWRAWAKSAVSLKNCLNSIQRMAEANTLPEQPQVSGGEIQTKGSQQKNADLPITVPHRRPIEFHEPSPTNGNLQGPHRKILRALSELRSIDKTQPPREMVAAWSGYSPGSGGFNNPLGNLNSLGLVRYPMPGAVSITDAGLAEVGECDRPDQEEINRRVMAILDGPHRKILAVLMNRPGEAITRAELAEASGYETGSGGFNNPLGNLRTAGFVVYPSPGAVKASDWLFLGDEG